MRYAAQGNERRDVLGRRGVGYVVSGRADRDRLTQVARLVYDQSEKIGRLNCDTCCRKGRVPSPVLSMGDASRKNTGVTKHIMSQFGH